MPGKRPREAQLWHFPGRVVTGETSPDMSAVRCRPLPGACFGAARSAARPLAPGLGVAVARRGIFRKEDQEDFGRVADRVAAGNSALASDAGQEQAFLRNAIASGALLTAGRHLVRGDATQPNQPMEFFVNCATAAASFKCFYLLLCGAGVGRAYDDALCLVDWRRAPRLFFELAAEHPDVARANAPMCRVLAETAPVHARRFLIPDSREGWAEALEIMETMAHAGQQDQALVMDFSAIRPRGQPIRGLGGRPAPGPLPLLNAFLALRDDIIAARSAMPRWEQALRVDDIMARAVIYGGLRRAARMAAKSWRDADAPRFAAGLDLPGHAGAAYAILVNADFWARLGPRAKATDPATGQARAVFAAASAAIHRCGEPGFINADQLVQTTLPDPDTRFGSARFPMAQGRRWSVISPSMHAVPITSPSPIPVAKFPCPLPAGSAWWPMWHPCWLALLRLKRFPLARCLLISCKLGMRASQGRPGLACAF